MLNVYSREDIIGKAARVREFLIMTQVEITGQIGTADITNSGDDQDRYIMSDDIVVKATHLALKQDEYLLWRCLANMAKNSIENDQNENNFWMMIHDWFTQRMISGADDTWSGRRNDFQRQKFDQFREIARGLSYNWEKASLDTVYNNSNKK